jgi:predicted TIM-barrel fold metal-dependent hydrolase
VPEPFIIDGVSHAYQLNEDNFVGRYGEIFANVMWSFHPVCTPPDRALTRDQWMHDWQADEFMETVFLESETEMVCTHSIPIYDAFKVGAQSIERGAELKRRWPDRVLWYAGVPVWEHRAALEKVRYYVEELGADGLKFYPSWHYEDGTRWYTMDDPAMIFPILDLARELGVKNIAVHKALPVGPVDSDAMRVNDIGRVALLYPDLNFQIIHAGMMFMDETKMLLMNYPNVYATLEASFLFLMFDKPGFTTMLREMLAFGGPEKVIYSANAPVAHPFYVQEEFARFELPRDFAISLSPEIRSLILGGNMARLHGIDVEARRAKLADDEFARARALNGLRRPWESVRTRYGVEEPASGAVA